MCYEFYTPHQGFEDRAVLVTDIRNYFAAHAPTEIPAWFEHTPEPTPKEPNIDFSNLSEEDKGLVLRWNNDPCFELPDHLERFQKARDEFRLAFHKWRKRDKVYRLVQWRWFYADEMMKEKKRREMPTIPVTLCGTAAPGGVL